MKVLRKLLTEAELSPPGFRSDPETGDIEYSPDRGTTWYPAPQQDPRTSSIFLLPALSGDDAKCRAAEGMTALVRAWVDERLSDTEAAQFAGGILGLASFIPGFGVLWAFLLTVAGFAMTIGVLVLEEAFTEDVYDDIRCIFFCNIDENGQMSEAQFAEAYEQLSELGAIARTWVQTVMNTVGWVGMSDAGVALEAAADCDTCFCDECERYLGDFGLRDISISQGSYEPGSQSIIGVSSSGGSIAQFTIPNCTVRTIFLDWQTCPAGSYGWYAVNDSASPPVALVAPYSHSTGTVDLNTTYTGIDLRIVVRSEFLCSPTVLSQALHLTICPTT
jgi:hypothetical protein